MQKVYQKMTYKDLGLDKDSILNDYRIACESREVSLAGRKEVFMGKAKFGVFGDGKELAQLVMARYFQDGDFRSGYYRDQTFMFAIGQLTIKQFFAQLYAHADIENEPATGGRLMNAHYGTRLLDAEGQWIPQTSMKNSSVDVSPTALQMPRALGLAYASNLYRAHKELKGYKDFSQNGREVSFVTIGNGSTSEGMFFETINAAGVLQVPLVVSVWDDDYAISVPSELQTTKESISEVLAGFQSGDKKGLDIKKVKGWDYLALCKTYKEMVEKAREKHEPVVIHVDQMTQPQGHSSSGSHERYKDEKRLKWEVDMDCIQFFKTWILEEDIAKNEDLVQIEKVAKEKVKKEKNEAWKEYLDFVKHNHEEAITLINQAVGYSKENKEVLLKLRIYLNNEENPDRLDAVRTMRKVLRVIRFESNGAKSDIQKWLQQVSEENEERYGGNLYSQSEQSVFRQIEIKVAYARNAAMVDGREVVQACFDAALRRDPRIFAIGEDVGVIGDVNQGFAGLQEKYGDLRVTDTGIREMTIVGQGLGAAMRGLRPIVEIQYLDYVIYALTVLSDDLATMQYRTKGGQKAPLIIRTRGHRLEGVWHSGSPMGMLVNSLRGMHVLVPRNMTQAAGMYNLMLKTDEPCLLIESLNGYRLKEKMPKNIGEFTVPLGIPETLRRGDDVSIVTYGSMCRIVMDAAEQLNEIGISCEVIDVQTLLPFDINHTIVESVKRTNRVIFADEDVPGGASAYMMQQVLEKQGAYDYLDSSPLTITAKEHRPAFANDGDYFSKPNVEDVFDEVYAMMHEINPHKFPDIY